MDELTKVVLVTAFEPFGDSAVNASATILGRLSLPSARLCTGILPVRRTTISQSINQLADQHSPDAIILLGEAGPEEVVRLELVALNHDDFRIPDNDGLVVEPTIIVEDGPSAYFSNLDVHDLAQNVPVDDSYARTIVSLSAGSFLCNHTYFLARHYYSDCPTLFIHIPSLRDDTHPPDAFDRVTNTVNCIVQAITATLAISKTD